ncbi:hypothetical protein ACMFMG_012122 [Clarireedia jacksonii]
MKERKTSTLRKSSQLDHNSSTVFCFRPQLFPKYLRSTKKWRERERSYLLNDEMLRKKQRASEVNILGSEFTTIQSASLDHEKTTLNTISTYEDANFEDYISFILQLNGLKFSDPQWKERAFDLSADQDRNGLHQDEILLASRLCLRCCQYFENKWKILYACMKFIRDGKQFKKRDCQKACAINVNKASKLWEAFEEAGLFRYVELFTRKR